jgi:putative DNA primase/helicase
LPGISTTPLLAADGSVRVADGYDPATRLWCCRVLSLRLPERPRREDAAAALRLLRNVFKTFPFADAARRRDEALGVEVVDLDHPPGRDESSFLNGLMTAICRASLWLAPGMLVVAPQVSGAGSGKGLLVRASASSRLAPDPLPSRLAMIAKNSTSGSLPNWSRQRPTYFLTM